MPKIIDKTLISEKGLGVSFNRFNGQCLDETAIWSSYDDLVKYAATDGRAYAGQVVAVATSDGNTHEVFIITSKAQDTHTVSDTTYDVYLQSVAGAVSDTQLNAAIDTKLSELREYVNSADTDNQLYTDGKVANAKTAMTANMNRIINGETGYIPAYAYKLHHSWLTIKPGDRVKITGIAVLILTWADGDNEDRSDLMVIYSGSYKTQSAHFKWTYTPDSSGGFTGTLTCGDLNCTACDILVVSGELTQL